MHVWFSGSISIFIYYTSAFISFPIRFLDFLALACLSQVSLFSQSKLQKRLENIGTFPFARLFVRFPPAIWYTLDAERSGGHFEEENRRILLSSDVYRHSKVSFLEANLSQAKDLRAKKFKRLSI